MPPEVVIANGVPLCVEAFGRSEDPAVLLIAGAGAAMTAWEDDFCALVAGRGRYVIRFDQRDTGRSVQYAPGAPAYRLADLAHDAVGVLDAVAVRRAQVVGSSLGGAVAQRVALDRPDRVTALALLSTSPVAPGISTAGLPPPALPVLIALDDVAPPDWNDRQSIIDHLVAVARIRAGGARPFDAAAARKLAGRIADHGIGPSSANHALIDSGPPWRQELGRIRVPTLVVHGSADPLVPGAPGAGRVRHNARAPRRGRPGAGHDLDRADWTAVIDALMGAAAPAS